MRDDAGDVIRMAPAGDDAYRAFIPASLALAVFLGFALGIHVAVSRLTDGGSAERNAELVQAHGQVQLLGFAGLYVTGMAVRLLPRFAGSRLAYAPLLPVGLGLMAAALAGRVIVLPLLPDGLHGVVAVMLAVAVFAASVCFFIVIAGTPATAEAATRQSLPSSAASASCSSHLFLV
jgi:hypothetical protein